MIGTDKATDKELDEARKYWGMSEEHWEEPPEGFQEACTLHFGKVLKYWQYEHLWNDLRICIKLQWKKEKGKPIRDEDGNKIKETRTETIVRILRFMNVKPPKKASDLSDITDNEQASDGNDIPSVCAECRRCGHETESYGRSMRSVRRCLVLSREECPLGESNYYQVGDEE